MGYRLAMTSPLFPAATPLSSAVPAVPSTPVAELDRHLERLQGQTTAWAATPIARRIALLEAVSGAILAEADAWARSISQVKGLDPASELHGEDWLAGPVVTVRNVRLLIKALRAGGRPTPPKLRQRGDGQWVADVLPWDVWDRIVYTGWKASVWIEPGKPPSQGRVYREAAAHSQVGLVLAAGNVTAIGAMDVLHKIFIDNEVVIMKMNPVNEAGGPHIERAFAPLVEAGLLAVVYGGAEVGKYLTDHPKVATIHITGSDRTHDAIIWGASADEQARNKQAGTPRLTKPITSELGCVTPVLVMPGEWTPAEIKYQAEQVAGMVTQNASFNCNAAKVVVTWKGWHLRDAFLAAVKHALREAPPRKAYYPGAHARYQGFLEKYPRAEVLGERGDGVVPWTFIPDVPPQKGEYALTNEAFCGVLAETSLDAPNATAFFSIAQAFANEACWGTLSCMVLANPATQAAPAFDDFIAGLRYGGIAINGWAGALFGLGQTTWGAYPGHPLEDIVSGCGSVHNAFMFDYPQKSVLTFPWKHAAKPVWSSTHASLASLGRLLAAMEASPSIWKLPRLFAAALRG